MNEAVGRRAAPKRRVLVTGAAGRIGRCFAGKSHELYDLRLMTLPGDPLAGSISGFGEVAEGDIEDLPRMKELCAGIDTVIHLAATPNASGTWRELLPLNIIGTYNTMVAAKSAGCRRLVFASSIHAVSGYPDEVQVKTNEPVNPGDLYGVSKAFGEALGRYMAEQEGLSVIAIRIGGFTELEVARTAETYHFMDAFISDQDMVQLLQRAIDVEGVQWAMLHGLSRNRFNRMDISDTMKLVGYEPQHDLAAENPRLKDLDFWHTLSRHNLKGGLKSGIREDV